MRILLTGGTSFIGLFVVRELALAAALSTQAGYGAEDEVLDRLAG